MSAPATRRVRRMWATSHPLRVREPWSIYPCKAAPCYIHQFPVAVLDLSPAAMEAHVEAMANALCCEHMGALPGAYSLTPEKDCTKGSESAYMWRSARAALAALMKGRTGGPRRA